MSSAALSARLQQSAKAAAQVLEAEHDALQGVAHCRQQMEQLAADSQALAARVHQRTEARIERYRERLKAEARLRQDRVANELAQLAMLKDADSAVFAPLDQAIARTIEEIIGAAQTG